MPVTLLLASDLVFAERPDSGPPERISESFCDDMRTHNVLKANSQVSCDRLRLVKFAYVGFDRALHTDGEVVVLDAVAIHVARIFAALRNRRFPIAKATPMNRYEGDDEASMIDNNTSAFNDRNIAGDNRISLHAFGLAIDLNPVQNPQITRLGNSLQVHPAAGANYLNRLNARPGKPTRPGMAEAVVNLFADEGFLVWGGYWDGPIDYQHFEVGRRLAERLVAATPSDAEAIFDGVIDRYRTCLAQIRPMSEEGRVNCVNELDRTTE